MKHKTRPIISDEETCVHFVHSFDSETFFRLTLTAKERHSFRIEYRRILLTSKKGHSRKNSSAAPAPCNV